MSDLNYQYRQYSITNACRLQKRNTEVSIEACCPCWDCKSPITQYINTYETNSFYTTEPSDLQQNYNTYFNKQAKMATLNSNLK